MASVSLSRKTFAGRVRAARLSANLSQSEFARALSAITKSKTTKSLVSQWESGKVGEPRSGTILAISAVTGFAQAYLLHGKGSERGTLPRLKIASRDTETRALFRRAVLLAYSVTLQKSPEALADAALTIFETLQDEPGAPDGALKRIARQLRSKR